jgi:glutamate carboxypeptidase
MKLPFPILALALAFAPVSAQAKLAPVEQKMAQVVDREQARTLALLEKLVNQNSGTLNFAGVEAVGKMMRAELEPLGFDVRWVPMAEAGRAGHIVAVHRGNGRGNRMLLIGHLDTVFEPDSPFQRFAMKSETIAEGPGVGDDKGGMVVMLAALRAMHQAGTLKGADIEIVLTGDEEDAGKPIAIARRDLIAAGRRADAALDFEGLSTDAGRDMGSISRRGSGDWEVRVTARSGHSSRIFSDVSGNGAIYELSRIITAFREELPEPNLTFNVGIVIGGATAALADGGIRGQPQARTTSFSRGRLRPRRRPHPGRSTISAGDHQDERIARRQPAGAPPPRSVRRRRLSADGADAGRAGAARPA